MDDRERYDVAAIMAEIRAENRRQAEEQGLLTDEEVEARAKERFRSYAREAHIDPRLLDRFLGPGHDWNTATDYLIRTHRPGLLAQAGLLLKRLVRPVIRLYTDHVLNRQTQVNQYVVHLLHDAIRDAIRLEARVAALERRSAIPPAEPGPRG